MKHVSILSNILNIVKCQVLQIHQGGKHLATSSTTSKFIHLLNTDLEMPKEEGKDESNTDAHDPSRQHEHQQPEVGQGLQQYQCNDDISEDDSDGDNLDHGSELWHRSQLTRKHFHSLCLLLQPLVLGLGSWLKLELN